MSLFLSTFINKIDKKGRVSVPASFRGALATTQMSQPFAGIVVFRSLKHPALEGCGMDRMQRLSDSIDRMDLFSDAQDDLVSAIFADSHTLSFDSEGRVSIPEDFLRFARVTDQVAFVGRGATFQLWAPEIFKEVQETARTRLQAEGLAVRLTLEEKKAS